MLKPLVHRAGFTLVEIIVAILISAILAIGVVSYIGDVVTGINSTGERNQLASAGRQVMDRITIEIHNALPNSIRTTTAQANGDQCMEFVPVIGSTSYINPPFTGSGGTTFDVVDFIPSQHGTTSGYAVIFPNRQNFLYDGDNGPSSGWPNFPTRRPIQEINNIADSANPDQSTVTLVKTHRFRRRSPTRRFFLAEDPISYCVVGDKLYRYTNYGFYTTQVTQEEESGVCEVALNDRCLPNYSAAPDKMLIIDSIDNSGLTAFSVISQTLRRNALIAIELNLTNGIDSVRLNHEILTRIVP